MREYWFYDDNSMERIFFFFFFFIKVRVSYPSNAHPAFYIANCKETD